MRACVEKENGRREKQKKEKKREICKWRKNGCTGSQKLVTPESDCCDSLVFFVCGYCGCSLAVRSIAESFLVLVRFVSCSSFYFWYVAPQLETEFLENEIAMISG